MLGQNTEAMAAHYGRNADQSVKLQDAVDRLAGANEAGTKLSGKSERRGWTPLGKTKRNAVITLITGGF